jgi:RHS repeat-associated protein
LHTVRTGDDKTIRMAYDALGRRVQKSVNGERTLFAWDGDALLAEKYEDQPAREYVYYPGTFEPLALIDGGEVYYYHNDVNGLPQELTKPNGDIVWSASYDAMGRVGKLLVNDVAQPLRLQGQYYDPEIDLCYNRYRYFDPHTCSFISQDPLGLAAGENVYAYAPNVWGWIDPLGLECKDSLSPSRYPNPDPPMDSPQVKYEPQSIDEVGRMRQGKGPRTKAEYGTQNIEAHHRQQIPVKEGGVLDEITEQVHRRDRNHTRHQLPSNLTPMQRAKEIRTHWKQRGNEYILPGEGI